jgi:hypothetical protein
MAAPPRCRGRTAKAREEERLLRYAKLVHPDEPGGFRKFAIVAVF